MGLLNPYCWHGTHSICASGGCEPCQRAAKDPSLLARWCDKVDAETLSAYGVSSSGAKFCDHGIHKTCENALDPSLPDVCCGGPWGRTCNGWVEGDTRPMLGPARPPSAEVPPSLPSNIEVAWKQMQGLWSGETWPKYMGRCSLCASGMCEEGTAIREGREASPEGVAMHSLYACGAELKWLGKFRCRVTRWETGTADLVGWHFGPHKAINNDDYESHYYGCDGTEVKQGELIKLVQLCVTYTASHVKTALKAGLHPTMNLSQAAADFYLLERLYTDNTAPVWNIDGTTTRVPSAPADTSRELFQIDVAKRYAEKVESLAKEFSTYIGMACGGELRYAAGSDATFREEGECEYYHEHDDECYECVHGNEGCDEDACGYHEHSLFDCYKHQPKCEAKSYEYSWNRKCTCSPKRALGSSFMLECEQETEECGHECFDGSCQEITCEEEHDCSYGDCRTEPGEGWAVELPGELVDYLEEIEPGTTARDSAWDQWLRFREEHGPDATLWMAECFEMTDHWPRESIGGAAWGACARLVYDYEVGNIRPSTFIDRCWTMEHNGGTIFNKIYLSGQKDQLLPVLECQHSEPYDVLAKQYSSIPEYWARSVREMRKGVTR